MASEHDLRTVSRVTNADLSALQYTVVDVNTTTGLIEAGSSGDEAALGVLQDKPGSGEVGRVAVGGQSKIVLGATLTPGTKVMGSAAGKAIAVTIGLVSIGSIVEGGADTEIGSILLEKVREHA
jgi:hypothetical protein